MKVQHAAEMLRGQVCALYDQLLASPDSLVLDDTDQTCLLRLVFELDRLGDRIEELAGTKEAT